MELKGPHWDSIPYPAKNALRKFSPENPKSALLPGTKKKYGQPGTQFDCPFLYERRHIVSRILIDSKSFYRKKVG
ncbi:hypothetical protein ACFOU2_01255 [Bacillus songklensis]|uniref:Uncharacterized protein n=1 Tax=Bacillus songklensis TaxID=1069116 RepID=A0ABV8AZ38_9BACI